MKNIFYISLGIILILLRLIFYPIKILSNLIYGTRKANIVGYAWYSKKEYPKLIASAKDDLSEIVPTYKLWQPIADEAIEKFQKKGCLVFKVNIEVKLLEKWLRSNGLINTCENRQHYVNSRLRDFLENSII